jgi:Nitroreductase family.
VLAGRPAPASNTPDLAQVARLLYLSAAFVRFAERADGRRFFFRTSRSAGGLFPLELYVSARGVGGLVDGVHWYDPLRHGLVQVGPAPDGEATAIVVTGVPWRTGWRYAERAFRHLYWDAGTTLAHSLALAESAGLGGRLWTRFSDAEVARLVGADGVQEFALAVITLGEGEPAIRPGGDSMAGSVAESPVEFPLVTLTQHAGDSDQLGEPWPPAPPLRFGPPLSDVLDSVIASHRSTRVMEPSAVIARQTFESCAALGLRGSMVPSFVAVHGVEGVEPGLYRWARLDRPIRAGVMRDELFRVCWDQELGRDAAFVVISVVDLDDIDDQGYREAQLQAGLVDGRLHLAAYALGIGASGMTFLDSEIEGLVGEPLAGLLLTCVGQGRRASG